MLQVEFHKTCLQGKLSIDVQVSGERLSLYCSQAFLCLSFTSLLYE